MDPRHPELAVKRMKDLISQYDRIERDIKAATTSAELGKLEREGGLVVQEMCLVAPRIHEALMQSSRNRRHDLRDLSKMVFPFKLQIPDEKMVDSYNEKTVENFGKDLEVEVETPAPKKKSSRKKKAEE